MPFGLKNAPATFQRMMNEVFHEHSNIICVAYLDDILIFATLQEMVVNVQTILNTLWKYPLNIQINKFFTK